MHINSSVDPFLPDLKLYCRILAKTEWDADDLFQEVLTKVYQSIQQKPDRLVSKAFLRRIAKNTWIDHYRKQQAKGVDSIFDEEVHQATSAVQNELLIREALEQLADQLNPRQMVLILIMDIFQFTAAETAELLHTTVGAVKEGLKRARNRMQLLASMPKESTDKRVPPRIKALSIEEKITNETFEQFLTAFRAGDAEGICRTYLALASKGIHIQKVTHSSDSYSFTFRDPNGHLIGFFQKV